MDERVQKMLESVRSAAESVTGAAADAAFYAGRKTEQLLSAGKINVQLAELRMQGNTALREIGELVYATHTGNPTDSEVLLEKLQEIDALRAQITALESELRAGEKRPVCPNCGAAGEKGDRFCRVCGGKL